MLENGFSKILFSPLLLGQLSSLFDTCSSFLVKSFATNHECQFPLLQCTIVYTTICIITALTEFFRVYILCGWKYRISSQRGKASIEVPVTHARGGVNGFILLHESCTKNAQVVIRDYKTQVSTLSDRGSLYDIVVKCSSSTTKRFPMINQRQASLVESRSESFENSSNMVIKKSNPSFPFQTEISCIEMLSRQASESGIESDEQFIVRPAGDAFLQHVHDSHMPQDTQIMIRTWKLNSKNSSRDEVGTTAVAIFGECSITDEHIRRDLPEKYLAMSGTKIIRSGVQSDLEKQVQSTIRKSKLKIFVNTLKTPQFSALGMQGFLNGLSPGTLGFYFLLAFADLQACSLSTLALNHVSLANSCLVDWASLITSYLISVKFLSEKITRYRILALLLGLAGALCIVISDVSQELLKIKDIQQLNPSVNKMLWIPWIGEHTSKPFDSDVSESVDSTPYNFVDKIKMDSSKPHALWSHDGSNIEQSPNSIAKQNKFLGNFLNVTAAIFMGVVTVMLEKLVLSGIPIPEILFKSFGIASILSFSGFWFFEYRTADLLNALSFQSWLSFVGAAISLAVVYFVAPFAIKQSSSSFFNLSLMTSTGLLVLLSALVFGDDFPPLYSVGLIIITSSLLIYDHDTTSAI